MSSYHLFFLLEIATLKIRIPSKTNGTKLLTIKIKLSETAKNLQEAIAAKLEVENGSCLKVIANGQVLDSEKTLLEQGVKNNKQIMALMTEDDAGNAEDPYARIKKIRSEAETVLKSQNTGFLSIEDQSGKSIHLPENERRSIIMALLLYEKGRVQLKNDKFSDALLLFLEADAELNLCNSSLVQSVDNVALLNLDIVWCYLNLKSLMQLPDAESRLKICEENFKRSYGENLSRVKSVKGSSENEKGLIARLHLMQGILYFHQNRRQEASVLMDMAEREIAALKVNPSSVTLLMEMGYSHSEAVTGLRSAFNSLDRAVNFILERRLAFEAARKDGKKENAIKDFLKGIGLTANPRSVITLSEMGFSKELCALALQKCNDDLQQALNLLQTNQNELKAELVNVIKPDKDVLEQLTALGFDPKTVETFLKMNVNNFQQTLDALLEMQNDFSLPQGLVSDVASTSSAPPTAGPSNSANTSAEDKKKAEAEKIAAEQTAFNELRNDLDHLEDDDEYLTVTLEKEEALLLQYKNALKN